jgi:hypothetical protein
MKPFARVSCFSAQTGKSVSAGSNPDRAVAGSSRATGFESGNLSGPGRPGPDHLEYIHAMFNCATPRLSGNLAGESFAATVENHPRYPSLRRGRHRALFERLDDIVASHLKRIGPHLRGLGFDESGIKIYRTAALTAFRAALPT